MDKVLIISYYWPPSGGAGVQRWLKLTKYMAYQNIEVHVLTVDPEKASYLAVDDSLIGDVHKEINVHTTNSFEPINYYSKLVGKSNVPTAGFSNVDNTNWKQKAVNFIRSNVFIPDPRKGWNRYAYQRALELINQFNIKHVITTSPPHSTQLIGLKLKQKLGNQMNWIVDFRDPWTDIYYYGLLQHTSWSHRINLNYEKAVVETADHIIVVGPKTQASFLSKSNQQLEDKFSIITNGYDEEDFENVTVPEQLSDQFMVTYTGTMSNHYEPQIFFKALGRLMNKYPDANIMFRMVGMVSQDIKDYMLEHLGEATEFISTVPHDKAIEYMLKSTVLLLILPRGEDIVPGKTFEYLAARKNVICIGAGRISSVLDECNAGKAFKREEEDAIFDYLERSLNNFLNGKPFVTDINALKQHSRAFQAQQVIDLFT